MTALQNSGRHINSTKIAASMTSDPYQPSNVQRPAMKSGRSLKPLMWTIVIGGILFIACGLFLPALHRGREGAQRMNCSSNIRQLALAIMNYEQTYKQYPPAYTVDSNGKPLHSWRTIILPFLEQAELHAKVDFSKPYNDPANAFLKDADIPIFRCPTQKLDKTMTTYVAVISPQGCLRPGIGVRAEDITDGTSNTLLLYETTRDHAVPWMAPQDADVDQYTKVQIDEELAHWGGSNIALMDGSCQYFNSKASEEVKLAMLTINGGENSPEVVEPVADPGSPAETVQTKPAEPAN